MKIYEKPEFEMVKFETENIMTTSLTPTPTPGSGFDDENELPGVSPKITD